MFEILKSKNMRYLNNTLSILGLAMLLGLAACGDDDAAPELLDLVANAGPSQTVEVEDLVTLDGSASSDPEGETFTYNWEFTTVPSGSVATLDGAETASPTFTPDVAGEYMVQLSIATLARQSMATVVVTASEPVYVTEDQMGRPAINTVFNFFGDAAAKNGYNMTLPSEGSTNADAFKGILDALQTYIGLDPVAYRNIFAAVPGAEPFGTNAGLAGALAVDVINCNKAFATSYGPADLANPIPFGNVLNGRALGDDVIDVTLLLTFAGIFVDPNDPAQQNALVPGLSSDNVQSNDVSFLSEFPYLAAPH